MRGRRPFEELDELAGGALDALVRALLLRGAPREQHGAIVLAAPVRDARLPQEGLGQADGARRVVGDDEAQRLEREVEIAGRLGAVGDLGDQRAVLLVGVERAPLTAAPSAPRNGRGAVS